MAMNTKELLTRALLFNPRIYALLAAVVVAWVVYILAGRIRKMFRPSAARLLDGFSGTERRQSTTERMGNDVLERFPAIQRYVQGTALRWVALEHKPPEPGQLMGQSLFFGALTLLGAIVIGEPLLLIGIPVAMGLPFFNIQGQADNVRNVVYRSLPEAAGLLSAELSAGVSVDEGVRRVARIGGPLGRLLQRIDQVAQQTNKPLFSRSHNVPGVVMQIAEEYQDPQLSAFLGAIDAMGASGGGNAEQAADLANGLQLGFNNRVDRMVERIDLEMMAISIIFLFLPFLVIILAGPMTEIIASLA